jgi:hypothetical protein
MWLHQARLLKAASERIDPFRLPGGFECEAEDEDDFSATFLFPTYAFLLGLSFENLIKGLIIAHGKSLGTNGKLDPKFTNHKVSSLIQHLDSSRFAVSQAEVDTLKGLEPFIQWAGRYPIPKTPATAMDAVVYSSSQHARDLKFWDRAALHLHEIGWFVKLGDRRIYNDGRIEPLP